MRAELLAAAALLLLPGCAACDAEHLFVGAKQGDLRAIHELGELGDPAIPPPNSVGLKRVDEAMVLLAARLAAPGATRDPFARRHTFEALRRLVQRSRPIYRDRHPELLDPLLGDADPELRWRCAWLLGRLELSRPALHGLVRDPAPQVAKQAVWALGHAKRDEGAVATLLTALDRPETEQEAVAALRRQTGDPAPKTAEAWREWARRRPGG
ncbi:MAG: HEAT repeat domain-containing protein [Planctomycetota bacterium]